MSILEPRSDDQTAMTSPTWDSRMARMSSISGPGQKLPRASMVRVMAGLAGVSSMSLTSFPMSFSDEDDGAAARGQVEGGHALDSVHEGIEVAGLEVQEIHGGGAALRIDPAQRLGLTQGLGPAGLSRGTEGVHRLAPRDAGLGRQPVVSLDPIGAEGLGRPVLQEDVHRPAERRGSGRQDS